MARPVRRPVSLRGRLIGVIIRPIDGVLSTELQAVRESLEAGDAHKAHALVARLLAIHPHDPSVQTLNAVVLLEIGKDLEALDGFESALKLKPGSSEALAGCVRGNLNVGRFAEAAKWAATWTALEPKNPAAHLARAHALQATGAVEQAIQAVDRSLALRPDDPECLILKARLLLANKLPGKATDLFRHAVRLSPASCAAEELAEILLRESHPAEALSILLRASGARLPVDQPRVLIAQALTSLRRFEEAEAMWSAAQAHASDPSAVLFRRASAELAAGRLVQANQLLSDAREAGADPVESFVLIAKVRTATSEHRPYLSQMLDASASGRLSHEQVIALNYALGKCFDDLSEFDTAMQCFDVANRTALAVYPRRRRFNRHETRAFIDQQISLITPDRIAEFAGTASESDTPLFVAGMLRSGTTLTETILSGHTSIRAGGEQMFWTQRAVEYLRWGARGLELDQKAVRRLASEYLALIDPGDQAVRYVVDKNPTNIHLAALLHGLYPNAKIVHVKRHAVDNLLSMWMTPFNEDVAYMSNRENMVFFYREYLRLVSHLQQILPGDRFTTFRYEEVTSGPQQTIPQMLAFLDLESQEACFTPELSARNVLTPSAFQVRQPINRRSQGRWRNYERWLGAFAELLDRDE